METFFRSITFLILLLCTVFISNARCHDSLVGYAVKDTLPVKDTIEIDGQAFIRVDEEASFPGGAEAWSSFLERHLKADVPVKRKAPAGQYLVVAQFIVDQKGNLTDLKPLTAHGYGMENELLRVLKKSPRWKPARINGRPVKAYRKQPLTFMVTVEK